MCGDLLLSFAGCSPAGEPVGCPSRQPAYFLCFAKESRQRKATRIRRPLRGCPAVLGTEGEQITRPRTSLRLRLAMALGAQTNLLDAAARRNLPSLRSSAPHTGKVKSKRLASPCLGALRAPTQRASAWCCVHHLFGSRIRRRGAQGPEGCAAQRRPANLFELRALKVNRRSVVFEGELFAGLPVPSTAGWSGISGQHLRAVRPAEEGRACKRVRTEGAPDPGRLSFTYFSLATQRKVGRLSGRTPDGLSRSTNSKERRVH